MKPTINFRPIAAPGLYLLAALALAGCVADSTPSCPVPVVPPEGNDPLNGAYSLSDQRAFLIFFADGHYLFGSHANNTDCSNGVQYGTYKYDAPSGAFQFEVALVNSLGLCGVSNTSGTISVAGDNTIRFTGQGSAGNRSFNPLNSVESTLIGSFQYGPDDGSGGAASGTMVDRPLPTVLSFLDDSHYFAISTRSFVRGGMTGVPGIEDGCYTYNSATGSFTGTTSCEVAPGVDGVDTNGSGEGPSNFRGTFMITGADHLLASQDGGLDLARIPFSH